MIPVVPLDLGSRPPAPPLAGGGGRAGPHAHSTPRVSTVPRTVPGLMQTPRCTPGIPEACPKIDTHPNTRPLRRGARLGEMVWGGALHSAERSARYAEATPPRAPACPPIPSASRGPSFSQRLGALQQVFMHPGLVLHTSSGCVHGISRGRGRHDCETRVCHRPRTRESSWGLC